MDLQTTRLRQLPGHYFDTPQGSRRFITDSNRDTGAKLALSMADGVCPAQSRAARINSFSIPTPLRPASRNSAVSPPSRLVWFPVRESPNSPPQPAGCARCREPHSTIRAAAQRRSLPQATMLRYSDGTIWQTAGRKLPGLTYLPRRPLLRFSRFLRFDISRHKVRINRA